MRRFLSIIGVALLAASLTACVDVCTVIKVNPDGSGFIEETVFISRVVLEQLGGMIQGMAEGFGAAQEGTFELPGLFDEAKLRAKATQYGRGVQYVSGEELMSETGDGYRAVYHFSDINLLQIDQNPSDKVGDNPLGSLGSVPNQFLTFQLQQGAPNTLVVRMPRGSQQLEFTDTETTESSVSLNQASPTLEPQMLAMFQNFFQDMRIAMSLDIQGSITGTNATHRDGSEITIMELDFGQLLADPNSLSYLENAQITSLEDAHLLMQNLPGIKVDLNEELVIQFQ